MWIRPRSYRVIISRQSCTWEHYLSCSSYFSFGWNYKERVYYKKRKKIAYWCMLLLPYTLFYLSKSYFTLSLFSLLSFSTLCSNCLSYSPLSSYGYCSYLYQIKLTCFSLFIAYQPFLSTTNTLQRCPLPFWLYGFNLHYLWACALFSFSSTTYPWQTLIHSILPCASLSHMKDKTLSLSLPLHLACIKWT